MAAVVTTYLAAGGTVVVLAPHLPRSRWLAVHLLGLGAATNAVMVWSRHFAQAVLHARTASERPAYVRLAALNAGVIGVLVGVEADVRVLSGTAAAVVVAAVGSHVISLVAMTRAHRLPGPLRVVAHYYVLAGAALVAGASIGGVMAAGLVGDDTATQQHLHLAHAQLNLFGWIGLAVLGTEVVLWPAVLRRRMVDPSPALARWTLLGCGAGLVALAGGAAAGVSAVAVAGGATYGVGVLVAVGPMVATLRRRTPRGAAPWSLGAAVAWLLAGLVVDLYRLASETEADAALHDVVEMLVVGMVAQALIGALTFLLPVTLGGGPAGNRRLSAILDRGWVARVAAGNAGLVVAVTAGAHPIRTAGWAIAVVGLGSLVPLAAFALARRSR
jgi:nitrite reductase (NO-forming)